MIYTILDKDGEMIDIIQLDTNEYNKYLKKHPDHSLVSSEEFISDDIEWEEDEEFMDDWE